MNVERICSHSVRITAVCLFTLAVMSISGCVRTEPVQKSPAEIEKRMSRQTEAPNRQTEAPTQQTEPPKQVSPPLPVEPPLLEGSGVTVWAKEFEGQLIEGLDGSVYEPYVRATIERVQKALVDRGLYMGPVNGILDLPTMKSIFAFQKANYHLQRCGIPTPHTRKMLEQGSHTDLNY